MNPDTGITERPSERERLLELVKAEMRSTYEFGLFSILPGLSNNFRTVKSYAKQLGIDKARAETFVQMLIGSGLWEVSGTKVTSNFELLDLGEITVQDYLAMTVGIVSQLTDSDVESHTYDTLAVVTNKTLVREFVGKVNRALRELHQLSQVPGVNKECIFSWSHTGVFQVEKKSVVSAGKEDEP